RSAPVVEQQRPDARAHPGADGEPEKRQRTRHEPLRPAKEPQQDDDADDQPVDARHSPERTRTLVQSRSLPRIASPRRFAPLALTAVLALLAGVVTGARHGPADRRPVAAFAEAGRRGDQRAMYALLSDEAKQRTSYARL